MTGEPKRARDIRVGDTLPDGSRVYRIAAGTRGLNIRARRTDGSIRVIRYMPETIIPGPGDRHPSRFADGHPWDRKGKAYLPKRSF
jgi:hypothetical protein